MIVVVIPPLMTFWTRTSQKIYKAKMKESDKRAKSITEIMNSIRIIKFMSWCIENDTNRTHIRVASYGPHLDRICGRSASIYALFLDSTRCGLREDRFIDKVSTIRTQEVKLMRNQQLLSAVSAQHAQHALQSRSHLSSSRAIFIPPLIQITQKTAVWWLPSQGLSSVYSSLPIAMIVVVLGLYAQMGGQLTASMAFTTITLMDMVRGVEVCSSTARPAGGPAIALY